MTQMNFFKIRIILFTIFLLSLSMAEYGGGYAGAAFRYSTNARHLSLGGAMVAEPNWGFHQFGNPALITNVKNIEFSTSFMALSLDRSIQVFSVSGQLPPDAAIGLSLFRAAVDNIGGRDFSGNDIGNFSTSDMMAMITFSRKISPSISGGLNLKVVFNDLDNDLDGKGIAFDVGVAYQPFEWLNIGAKLANVTGQTTWKYDGGATDSEDLLSYMSLGSTISLIQDLKIMIQSDTYMIPDGGKETKIRFGGEYDLNEKFKLRAGLNGNKFTAGFGVLFKSEKHLGIQLDYAIDPGYENEGISHIFSLSTRI